MVAERRIAGLIAVMISGVGALALSACAAGPGAMTAAPVASAVRPAPPPAVEQPGAIIGADAAALTQRFGTARLTLPEGDATKLQFASPACVLDIYLYPGTAGQGQIATHLASRRRDGSAMEPEACIAALERGQ